MIAVILCSILGVLKGLRDVEMKLKITWKNKYSDDMILIDYWQPKSFIDKLYKRYHELFKLAYKERFFLSGTALVFLTDTWHFLETLIFILVIICLFVQVEFNWLVIPLCYLGHSISFHMFYSLNSRNK